MENKQIDEFILYKPGVCPKPTTPTTHAGVNPLIFNYLNISIKYINIITY